MDRQITVQVYGAEPKVTHITVSVNYYKRTSSVFLNAYPTVITDKGHASIGITRGKSWKIADMQRLNSKLLDQIFEQKKSEILQTGTDTNKILSDFCRTHGAQLEAPAIPTVDG